MNAIHFFCQMGHMTYNHPQYLDPGKAPLQLWLLYRIKMGLVPLSLNIPTTLTYNLNAQYLGTGDLETPQP